MKRIITRALSLALMLMLLLQCLSAVACNIRYNEKDAPKNDSVQSNDESVPSFTPLASGQTENGLSWDISDSGTLTISGSGVMPDYAYNTMPWYGNAARVTKLVISEGVQNVGRCAFYGFNRITEVTLPKTMTVIGEYAFFGCSALKRIAIPENVFSIGAYAFRKSGVTAFEFAKTKGWTADGNEVDVTLATNLTSTCYKMTFTRTEVDETTEEILAGGFRFRLSEDGKSYELLGLSGYLGSALLIYGALNGKPVTTIAPEAFMDCASFTSLIIEDGVTTLGDRAFANCSSLQLVILPASIISIGDSVFNNSPEAAFYFEEGFGESEEFTAGEGNDSINEESAWFYSEEEPEWDGNYWRYVLGIPVQWEKTEPVEPERPEGPYVPEDASVYVPNSADWDGRSFVVLTYQDRAQGMAFNVVDLTVKNGADLSDPINKAVYERNLRIEQDFNAKVERDEQSNISYNNIIANTMANGNEYGAYMMKIAASINLALNGDALDLNSEVKYLDLQKSWWDTSAIDSLTVGGKAYFALGDINTVDNDATWCVLFNKYIRERISGMPNFYDMVKDGDWTIENLNYWAKKAVIEDNSGYYNKWELDSSYQYGLYFQDECATVLLQSSGVTPFIKTSSGRLASNLNSADMNNAIGAIKANLMLDNTVNNAWALNINDVNYSGGDVWQNIARGGFMADKALFYMCHCGSINLLRGMEHDFGILPVPKVSASQENYGNTVQYGNATCYSVPYNTPDPDFSGFMLEALCYYSSLSYSTVDSLKMAYYETLLQRKASRDDGSWDMLPLVFDNRIFDIACAKNTGNINGLIVQATKTTNAWQTIIAGSGNAIVQEIDEDVIRLMYGGGTI